MLKYGKSFDMQRFQGVKVAIDAAQVVVEAKKVVAHKVVVIKEFKRVKTLKCLVYRSCEVLQGCCCRR